jgi:hypothetical protein
MNVHPANFGGTPYRELGDLARDLEEVVVRYEGRVPLAGALGVLSLIQADMIRKATPPTGGG